MYFKKRVVYYKMSKNFIVQELGDNWEKPLHDSCSNPDPSAQSAALHTALTPACHGVSYEFKS